LPILRHVNFGFTGSSKPVEVLQERLLEWLDVSKVEYAMFGDKYFDKDNKEETHPLKKGDTKIHSPFEKGRHQNSLTL
jgi:hypothetical protein